MHYCHSSLIVYTNVHVTFLLLSISHSSHLLKIETTDAAVRLMADRAIQIYTYWHRNWQSSEGLEKCIGTKMGSAPAQIFSEGGSHTQLSFRGS